jgi:site-specific DNA recombinase
VPLHHYAVGHCSGLQIAADDPQHARVCDPVVQLPHEHVVMHAVEEFLEVHVHHPAPSVLHVLLRLPHGVVRPATRPETVAVLAEGRIEDRLQHLKHQLLHEAVEHRRNANLPHSTATLRNQLSLHRTRPVAPPQQLLADRLPVLVQIRLQLFHPHPVDAGTALVAPHALERFLRVLTRDHPFHQTRVLAS